MAIGGFWLAKAALLMVWWCDWVCRGTMTIVLDGYNAPVTAGNFVDLVNRGFYNGMVRIYVLATACGFLMMHARDWF